MDSSNEPNETGGQFQSSPLQLTDQPSTSSQRSDDVEEGEDETKNNRFYKTVFKISGFSKKELVSYFSLVKKKTLEFYELGLVFLELHLIKLIIFLGFWMSVKNPSLIHVTVTILSVTVAITQTHKQIIMSRVLSAIAAVFLLSTTIYQVTFIDHKQFDVTCVQASKTVVVNNAEWLGFRKIADGATLSGLLNMNIVYIVMVTVDVVVRMRQRNSRINRGRPDEPPAVLFPTVTRKDADQDLWHMLKYLSNYGFFKFGVEVCFICTVIVIGLRMDIVALLYALWLSCFILVDRRRLNALWPAFQWFIAVSIVIQYLLIVVVPPGLCLQFPWNEGALTNLQRWAMLPDPSLRNMANKLVAEFILLMFVTRQTHVFQIDCQSKPSETEYPGGTNESVLEDIRGNNGKKFVNPTPDFTSVRRNWLDLFKYVVLFGLFWCSLAMAFVAGTSRVNLFSLGYLIWSFAFLWQGSDFYLRSIDVILKWWIRFIGYNVLVIASKTILQIPGCLLRESLEENSCWLIRLLSIVCVHQEGSVDTSAISRTVSRTSYCFIKGHKIIPCSLLIDSATFPLTVES